MSVFTQNQKISINYVEFNVKNIHASKAFYQHLGWTFTDFGELYCEFNSGSIKGGFFQTDDIQAKGGALIILYVQDLAQALDIIKNAGGKILQDIYAFPGGKRFHFEDLDGYQLAIWSDQTE